MNPFLLLGLWVGDSPAMGELEGTDRPAVSIRPNDFYFVADPIRRQVDSSAVPAGFNPLFDHLFAVYFEFDLVVGSVGDGFFLIVGILTTVLMTIVWHVDWPLSQTSLIVPFVCHIDFDSLPSGTTNWSIQNKAPSAFSMTCLLNPDFSRQQ